MTEEQIRQRKLIREGMGTVMRAPDKAAPGKKRKVDALEAGGYETVGATDEDAPRNKQVGEDNSYIKYPFHPFLFYLHAVDYIVITRTFIVHPCVYLWSSPPFLQLPSIFLLLIILLLLYYHYLVFVYWNEQAREEDDDIEIVPRGSKGGDGGGGVEGDDRKYDSDNEQYDSHDRAMTLALGTLMLRRSREKALVDASYNRYI